MNMKEILGSLMERMRGPLYVPTVSTISLVIAVVGLVVALIGVTVAIYNGRSQHQRWETEDHLRDPRPQVSWSNELVGGKYRTLNMATTNALTNPIRLVSIEIMSPAGGMVAPYSDYISRKVETPSKSSTVNRRIFANTFDSIFYVAVNTPKTPNDQGDYVDRGLSLKSSEPTFPL